MPETEERRGWFRFVFTEDGSDEPTELTFGSLTNDEADVIAAMVQRTYAGTGTEVRVYVRRAPSDVRLYDVLDPVS